MHTEKIYRKFINEKKKTIFQFKKIKNQILSKYRYFGNIKYNPWFSEYNL
jgi:hypothetical protein